MKTIDNRKLMPVYRPDEEVEMEGWHPDWIKGLIIAQFRVETATPEGTFDAAVRVLDHYAEMGVNCLWLNPIFQRAESGYYNGNNGYGSYGPHAIDKRIAGTDGSYDERFAAVRRFVDEAHKRNIRIISDIVVWGVCKESDAVTAHPEAFAYDDGLHSVWGGWAYNWQSPCFMEWYVSATVDMLTKTGLDGLRCDLEPTITGYRVFREVRRRMYEKGRKICIFSEGINTREETYDFEEGSIGTDTDTPLDKWGNAVVETLWYFMDPAHDIVNSVKTGFGIGSLAEQREGRAGQARFYVNNLCCHDHFHPGVNGDRVVAGYQAILAPFIPMWWIGEEWNNPLNKAGSGVMFYTDIHWELLNEPENRAFFEDFKRLIAIRRTYADIFEYAPDNHRESNICRVEANTPLVSYARYHGGRAVLVLPNSGDKSITVTATIPAEAGVGGNARLTELFGGQDLKAAGKGFTVVIPAHTMSVILAE